MADAQSVINSARYDLTDYTDGVGVGIEYDDAELLNYLNRMVGLMDYQLSSLGSDLVEVKEEAVDTVEDQDYVDISSLNSGLWTRIRSVWLETRRLQQISLNYLRYTSMFRSDSSLPTEWALSHQKILFPQDCDDAYDSLVIHYDAKSAALTLTSDMPYYDLFNEFLREMLVMTAQGKKKGILNRADSAFNNMFRARAMHEEIARGFIPKTYNYREF